MNQNNFPRRMMSVLAAALCVAGSAHAGSQTNVMNNIVTLADACDIVAIGIDFGVKSAPIPASGYAAQVTTNTSTGNAVTGNTAHPKAAADSASTGDGTSGNNSLALLTGVSALDGAVSTVLSTVVGALPGVYVACTATPTSITLVSTASGATLYNFPTTLGALPSGTFSGKMAGVGQGAIASNTVDYNITFAGVAVNTTVPGGGALGLPSLFIAPFTAIGAIPGTQTGTVVPGQYWDGAIATVNF